MDQTSQAAAIAVQIAGASGVIGMLTVFARASRTPAGTPSRRSRSVAAVPEPVVVLVTDEQPAPGAEGAIVKQRGVPTSV